MVLFWSAPSSNQKPVEPTAAVRAAQPKSISPFKELLDPNLWSQTQTRRKCVPCRPRAPKDLRPGAESALGEDRTVLVHQMLTTCWTPTLPGLRQQNINSQSPSMAWHAIRNLTNEIGEGSPATKVDTDSANMCQHSMGAPVRRYSSKEGEHNI